ncbi:hypothetical protein HPP92_003735 [Vanilla planifolia]|uniref:Uncharacterized protein n=1 Tax=Vanilla planifolia TaxID=51239 RepID=A0A835VNT6_VANPL|nr:hypothetical protein HPP92_003735 [Vanilla planifolia]
MRSFHRHHEYLRLRLPIPNTGCRVDIARFPRAEVTGTGRRCPTSSKEYNRAALEAGREEKGKSLGGMAKLVKGHIQSTTVSAVNLLFCFDMIWPVGRAQQQCAIAHHVIRVLRSTGPNKTKQLTLLFEAVKPAFDGRRKLSAGVRHRCPSRFSLSSSSPRPRITDTGRRTTTPKRIATALSTTSRPSALPRVLRPRAKLHLKPMVNT